jgi:hypothetical protein
MSSYTGVPWLVVQTAGLGAQGVPLFLTPCITSRQLWWQLSGSRFIAGLYCYFTDPVHIGIHPSCLPKEAVGQAVGTTRL